MLLKIMKERTHTLRKCHRPICESNSVWPSEICCLSSSLPLLGISQKQFLVAWLLHKCFGLKEQMCLSNRFLSFRLLWQQTPRWWHPWALCYHLLRVQFITPVHYSICWALSTRIIESYASIINYTVHVHNSCSRVYSFIVKIHCVGTLHTRSPIENKLMYKYILFFPLQALFYRILHFSVMIFIAFIASAKPMKGIFYISLIHSFLQQIFIEWLFFWQGRPGGVGPVSQAGRTGKVAVHLVWFPGFAQIPCGDRQNFQSFPDTKRANPDCGLNSFTSTGAGPQLPKST